MATHESEFGNGIHPRITGDFQAKQADTYIESFVGSMAIWELRLNDALAKGDEAAARTIEEQAVEELDEAWKLGGKMFLVSGKWLRPDAHIYDTYNLETGMDETVIRFSYDEEEVFESARSAGVGWKPGTKHNQKRLGFAFDTGTTRKTMPYITAYYEHHAVALPEDVSLALVPDLSEIQSTVHQERVREVLELSDKLALLYMSQPSFLTRKRAQQRKAIDTLVGETNDIVTAPGVGIYVALATRGLYYRHDTSTPYGFAIEPPEDPAHEIELQGRLLGVDILERGVLDYKNLSRSDDFINKLAGMCMILEVVGGEDAMQAYVPISWTNLPEANVTVYQSD